MIEFGASSIGTMSLIIMVKAAKAINPHIEGSSLKYVYAANDGSP